MKPMTETEEKMYDLIKEAGEWQGTAALGFAMWTESKNPKKFYARTPQGMALAAGKVVRGLIDKGYIRTYSKSGQTQSFYQVIKPKSERLAKDEFV